MNLFAGRMDGLFGAGYNDAYKQLPMSGALWNAPGQQPMGSATLQSPVLPSSNLYGQPGHDTFLPSSGVHADFVDKPPPTYVARFFTYLMNKIYNVDESVHSSDNRTGAKPPIYHFAKY